MGIDKVGIDKVGIDKVGRYRGAGRVVETGGTAGHGNYGCTQQNTCMEDGSLGCGKFECTTCQQLNWKIIGTIIKLFLV